MSENPSGLDAVIQAAREAGLARSALGGDYAVVPSDCHVADLEMYREAPRRAAAVTKHNTVGSLIAYVERHKTPSTAIFADVDRAFIVAIIDYHGADNAPAWGVHCASYAAPHSEEWRAWASIDGKALQQPLFARFIEENVVDIRSPDGATMLEVARSLQVERNVSFRQGTRLHDGTVQLGYREDTTASGGGANGSLSIPEEIELGIPVFYGGDHFKVRTFFRYRISEGKLTMWTEMHRKKEILDAAFSDVVKTVREKLSGVPLYEGTKE